MCGGGGDAFDDSSARSHAPARDSTQMYVAPVQFADRASGAISDQCLGVIAEFGSREARLSGVAAVHAVPAMAEAAITNEVRGTVAVVQRGAVPLVEAETPVVVGLDVRRQVTVDDRPTDLDGVAAVLESYEQPAALVRVDGTLPTTATLDLVARIRPVVRSVQIQVVPSPDPR